MASAFAKSAWGKEELAGRSVRAFARALGRAASTISREIRRNALEGGAPTGRRSPMEASCSGASVPRCLSARKHVFSIMLYYQ